VTVTRIGCSGWNYRDWRGDLYPADAPARIWLELYAERFDTVEVNTTFYRLPKRDAVARWVQQTPQDFLFAVKASRYLTHIKRLRDMETGVQRFYERIEPLIEAKRLGPVLWQLPPNFARDDDRLGNALNLLPDGRHAFEFRHESWFCDEVDALLRAHDIALVWGDDARRPLPQRPSPASWAYVRLHYGHRGRDGNYGPRELEEWAERVRRRAGRGDDVYMYLNNDWSGYAPRNAKRLRELLGV
jgi:uncharacterized protein YecE (DUF72 family)